MIGHVPFYRKGERYRCTPGFVRLLETLAPLFGHVELWVPRFQGEPKGGACPVEVPNLEVRELPAYYRRWEMTGLLRPVRLIRCLWAPVRRCDAAWILMPNYLGLLAWATCLLHGKRFAVRVAGNWPELLRLGFARIGHPRIGWLVAAAHRLILRVMMRTSAVTFVHGCELLETYGRHNSRVVGFVSSTITARDVGATVAAGKEDERRILYVGGLNYAKGLLELFEAFRRLREDGLNVRLDLAGEGARRPDMEKAVADLALENTVRFLGWVPPDDLKAEYESSDVLVMPSHSETGPKVVLEAMARGLPVVATRVGSVPLVIDDGKSGLIVPPRNADALYKALRRILTDEGLRQELARRGLARAPRFTMATERLVVAEGLQRAGFAVSADGLPVERPRADRQRAMKEAGRGVR